MADYSHLQLSPQGFLFDHHTGTSYSMNSIAAFVLRLLLKGEQRDSIREAVCDTYEVAEERASLDVDEFIALLVNYRLAKEEDV
jgi:hypothetical protein